MRRLGLAILVIVLGSTALAGTASAAQGAPFEGSWWSIDPVDQSIQHLSIVGGSTVQMTYVDDYGTTCLDLAAPTLVFTGFLTGRVDGNDLYGTFRQGTCGSLRVLNARIHFAWTFRYDPSNDTMFGAIEDGPATWYRE